MIRTSAVSPEHRANLRLLRADFEVAFAAVSDPDDRLSDEYLEADARYRTWIKAMDAIAIALLDDIDALEASSAERKTEAFSRSTASAVVDGDPNTGNVFEEAREIIGSPEPEGRYDAFVDEVDRALWESG